MFVLKTQLFLRYHKTYSCSVLQWISHDWSQSGCSVMIHPLVCVFCFYFCASATQTSSITFLGIEVRLTSLHFSRFFQHFFKMGMVFALFPQLLETYQVITPFLSLTEHIFAVPSLRCLSIWSHGLVSIQLNKVVTNLIAPWSGWYFLQEEHTLPVRIRAKEKLGPEPFLCSFFLPCLPR